MFPKIRIIRPIPNIKDNITYLYTTFSIKCILDIFIGIKASPSKILQVENEIIFSLEILVIFLIILLIINITKLKYANIDKIQSKINNESTLCRNLPSSICLTSKKSEFIGSLFVVVLNKVSIEETVMKSRVKDIK